MTGRLDDLDLLDTCPEPDHLLYALPSRPAADRRLLDNLAVEWAAGKDLLTAPGARERLRHACVGDLLSRAYPGLRPDRAAPLAAWLAWLFVVDDHHDRTRQDREELGRMARALGHIWRLVAPVQSPRWRTRFLAHVGEFLAAFRQEGANRRAGQVPALRDYIPLRRASGGITPCLDLLEYSTGLEVPPALHGSEPLRVMFDRAADVVVWVNDAVSLKKELAIGETNNGVLVVQREHATTLQDAVRHVYARVTRDIQEFLAAEKELCASRTPVSDRERAALLSLITGLRAWMRGNLDWSTRARRYG
ncbi:hypothetical protein BN159_1440 [Streptomyces davaonensis JCM 4913]|uniref:Terpene synthase n=1 Tax=Streptomyces davaonensis (strain DSM 101723 / JCM 4913 / KCC S-0913 / 768) TaxID=1214101 RepID=K4QZM9_STRDJ|nr:hypothetical protein [Streptomyces davaonensis]CCK25819.1 hypothetical protein BN159_1440 [Streptomyces davaonensis JCM 4913]